MPHQTPAKRSLRRVPQIVLFARDQTCQRFNEGERTLHVVSEMEDRLDAGCPRQQCVLLMLFERPVVLRNVHRQSEISLVPGRQRSRDRMPERPAQPQRSLVRESCRLIPAFWLGM